MGLVRVPEGDEWLSELLCVPNKSLTPITLDLSSSLSLSNNRKYAARPRFGSKTVMLAWPDSGGV